MNKIYNFNSKVIPALSEVGGKGKALIEMTKAGYPVPKGFILTVEFFRPWIERIKETEEWNCLISQITKEKCDTLKALSENLTFNVEQEKLFFDEVKNVDSDIFAVRSSSPEEDLEGTSFAGMYETFLGIKREKLEKNVAKAFASMFDFRVMEYKAQQDINIINTKIAVIIQKQLYSQVSGIGFSINPQNNNYDEVMLNASFGLGEYIVSGKVSPDNYIVDSSKNNIISKKINDKKIALFLCKNGETKEVICDEAEKTSLTDKQVFEVSTLIKRCEHYYGKPIDTEWAYENGKLYLLQARPITTYFPLYKELVTNPTDRKQLYLDIVKMTQGFQWSMSELGCEIFCELINRAKQGLFPVGKEGLVYGCHGRTYILLGNLGKIFGKAQVNRMISSVDPTFDKLISNIRFDEYLPKYKPEKTKGILKRAFKSGIRFIPEMISVRIDFEKAVETYYKTAENCLNELEKLNESKVDFSKQIDIIFDIFDALVFKMIPVMMSINATSLLRKMFNNKDIEDDILALNMDLKGNPTSEMGHKQIELASYPEFISVNSFEEFSYKLNNNGFSKEFIKKYNNYMKRYGCRGIGEIDIASIRTHENLEDFYNILKQLNIFDNAIINVKAKKKAAYDRLLKEAEKIGKKKKFIKLSNRLEWMGLREHPKYMYVYAVNLLRKNVLEISKTFVLEGRLNCAEDIFFLKIEEITKAQNDKSLNLIELVEQERKIRRLTENVKYWPTIFSSRGEIFTVKRKTKEGEILGEPVSPGVVRGRAKVLHAPFEKKLEKGEILVTMATEPSWTPIFINACAVIMEIGGALQHGAIIAREYGLPCVTGIENATEIIKDGDLIEVDGTNGFIKIIEKVDKVLSSSKQV